MNEKEKREFYIANCRCCLLAEAMKSCEVCVFKIGLQEKPIPVNSNFLKDSSINVLAMEIALST